MTCQSSWRSPTIAIGFGALVVPSRMRIPRPPQNRTTFTIHTPPSDDVKLGDRENQPSPPRLDVVKLLADLVPEIPGQDENVVGPGLGEAFRRVDRDMRAREELPLLHRAPVNGVLQEIRADPAVIEERVSLARGAVARDGMAVARRREQKPQQIALDPQHLAGEALMAGQRVQPGGLLLVKHRLHPCRRLASV